MFHFKSLYFLHEKRTCYFLKKLKPGGALLEILSHSSFVDYTEPWISASFMSHLFNRTGKQYSAVDKTIDSVEVRRVLDEHILQVQPVFVIYDLSISHMFVNSGQCVRDTTLVVTFSNFPIFLFFHISKSFVTFVFFSHFPLSVHFQLGFRRKG